MVPRPSKPPLSQSVALLSDVVYRNTQDFGRELSNIHCLVGILCSISRIFSLFLNRFSCFLTVCLDFEYICISTVYTLKRLVFFSLAFHLLALNWQCFRSWLEISVSFFLRVIFLIRFPRC